MSISFEIIAEKRSDLGKNASRRLRRLGKVPAVVYGNNQKPLSISLEQNYLTKVLQHESFYTDILNLTINNMHEKVVLKDLQRHPYKDKVVHLDFMRVSATEKIKMHIPLHFIGGDQSPGVKSRGVVSHLINNIEVSCLPQDLPKFIEIDLSNLKLDTVMHVSQLTLPPRVESVALSHNQDPIVLTIHIPAIKQESSAQDVSTEDAQQV